MANQATNQRGKDEARTAGSPQYGQGPHGADVKNRPGTEPGAMDKAREMASGAMDKAKETASALGERAESAASAAAGGMKSLAGTIRENAPREGMLGSASGALASGLESGGRYLQEEGLGGLMDDLTALIRRNPLPAVCVGIGIGFLLASTTRR